MMLFLQIGLTVILAIKDVQSENFFLNAHKPKVWFENRIVGGEEVSPNSIPNMAGLFITKPTGLFFCGGTLISPKYVITSASCLEEATSVEVRLGAHKINENEPTQTRVTSTEFNIHTDWNSTTLTNDIATIVLPSAVTLNNYIQAATLPKRTEQHETFSGYWGSIYGWGRDSDHSTVMSEVLRAVDVEVMSNTNCIFYYGPYITPGHICTSGVDGGGSCTGDAGGPLIVEDKLVGIVSFGSGDGCESKWPSVFTRITSYFDWIEHHTDVTIVN